VSLFTTGWAIAVYVLNYSSEQEAAPVLLVS
jgi:hypothetical protein